MNSRDISGIAPLLDIGHLRISFPTEKGKVRAVDDISFQVRNGEVLAIVGESGSGKSVTALSVMRLLEEKAECEGTIRYHTSEGAVELNTLSPAGIRKYRGRDISMIFQEPMTSLNPVFTCGAQVAEVISLHKKISRRGALKEVQELFGKVRLPHPERIIHRYPHQLSGGQKQRVMIAMAMSCQPRLLIADEPTTALDVTVQQSILQLIRDWQREAGMSVIFISHDLGVVAELADRVLVMYKGKIVEEGPVNDIFQHPRHPYTKGLLACRPPLNSRPRRLPVISDFMMEKDGELMEISVPFHSPVSHEEGNAAGDKMAEQENTAPLLSLQHVTTAFPAAANWLGKPTSWIKAVDDVSFDLYPGEMLGLVGESGCGKSTLGRSVLQLIRPDAGVILYKGKDLCRHSAREMRGLRKEMQMVFQDPYSSLNPRQTVGEALLEPLRVHRCYKDDRTRRLQVLELLDKVGLQENQYHRYPHEFSGGQRQRIGIARALVLRPELIICDEAVAALDVSVQAQVLNLLMELREAYKFTCIFISHDLAVVKFLCDRIIVMNKGKIEETGPAETVYRHPRSAYTRKLIAAIPTVFRE